MVEGLGTIARSGTKAFMDRVEATQGVEGAQLIGTVVVPLRAVPTPGAPTNCDFHELLVATCVASIGPRNVSGPYGFGGPWPTPKPNGARADSQCRDDGPSEAWSRHSRSGRGGRRGILGFRPLHEPNPSGGQPQDTNIRRNE